MSARDDNTVMRAPQAPISFDVGQKWCGKEESRTGRPQ